MPIFTGGASVQHPRIQDNRFRNNLFQQATLHRQRQRHRHPFIFYRQHMTKRHGNAHFGSDRRRIRIPHLWPSSPQFFLPPLDFCMDSMSIHQPREQVPQMNRRAGDTRRQRPGEDRRRDGTVIAFPRNRKRMQTGPRYRRPQPFFRIARKRGGHDRQKPSSSAS